MTRKIVYLAVHSSYSHMSLAYAQLRAYTENIVPGCDWQLVESTINDDPWNVFTEIIDIKPDFIVATCYLFNVNQVLDIVRRVKKILTRCPVVLGGPEFLGDNRSFLTRNRFVNAVMRGDETTFAQLLDSYGEKDKWAEIRGLCYLGEEGKYADNGTAIGTGSLDQLPSPYDKDYFPIDRPFVQFQSSRGCSGGCNYCTSASTAKLRFHSCERVIEDLGYIYEKGIREVRLIDRTFNDDISRSIDLIKTFKGSFADMRFHLEINPARLSEEWLTEISSAPKGMFHLETGVQTCSDESLTAISRRDKSVDCLNGLKKLVNVDNIEVHADLIAGLPEQDLATVFQDVMNLIDIGPDEIQLEILKVLPGTGLYDSPPTGLIYNPEPPYEVLRTKQMTTEELYTAMQLSRLIDSYYNQPSLRSAFVYAVQRRKGADFLHSFLATARESLKTGSRSSLRARAETLEAYLAKTGSAEELELLRFSWLAAGLSPQHLGLKSQKTQIEESGEVLWENPTIQSSKRCIGVNFQHAVGDLWLNPGAELIRQPTRYIFHLAMGNVVARIEQCSTI